MPTESDPSVCGAPTTQGPCPLPYGHPPEAYEQDRGDYTGPVCTDPGQPHELAAVDAYLDRLAAGHTEPAEPDEMTAADRTRQIAVLLGGPEVLTDPDRAGAIKDLEAILDRTSRPEEPPWSRCARCGLTERQRAGLDPWTAEQRERQGGPMTGCEHLPAPAWCRC